MQKSPYLILKISENATEEEIDKAYYNLRKKYSEERFKPGEDGRIAAENLSELDEAYEDAIRQLRERVSYKSFGTVFGEIENLIKAGELDRAQRMLDDTSERPGEWHYLQSIIFYRKNWFTESLKQLDFAMAIEPGNTKFSDAHTRLKNLMYGPPNDQASQGQHNQQQIPLQQQKQQQMGCCGESGAEESCCLQLLCMQCLCNMGGGC